MIYLIYQLNQIRISRKNDNNTCFLVNHTKKQYVDMTKVQDIHPLPLLTSSGNGRGKGDYEGEQNFVGSWAGDVLSVERSIPVQEHYQEIIPNFLV